MSRPPKPSAAAAHQCRQLRAVEQVALDEPHGSCALRIQLLRQRRGIVGGAAVVQHHVGAGRDAACRAIAAPTRRARAGNEHGLVAERGSDVLAGSSGGVSCAMGADYDGIAAHSMLPALSAEERAPQPRAWPRTSAPRSQPRAAGCRSSASWSWRSTRPGSVITAPAAAKLGAGGDFVTAPEVSDLFGRCLARQCAAVLRLHAAGEILELGAGTGRMAAALLTRARRAGRAAGALRDPRGERRPRRAAAGAPRAPAARSCASGWCGSSGCRRSRSRA